MRPAGGEDPENEKDEERADVELLGILGYPLGHSLSPAMHNAALRERGIAGIYLPLEVPPPSLVGALEGLRHLPFRGANVTVPHKEAAFGLVDELAPSARKVGAVNTLQRRGGLLVGHNTDGAGFLASLAEADVDPAGRRVVILGAGGAARAVAVALVEAGAVELVLINRHLPRAQALATELAKGGPVRAAGWEAMEEELGRAELLVNATCVGMHPRAGESPVEDLSALPPAAPVVDLVYNPRPTALLARARDLGHPVLDGLGMLVHQGALSFGIWFGEDGPVQVMRRAAVAALEAR